MANTNTQTTNYSLPVPELGNAVTYDIPRIKSALTTVDATLFTKQDVLVSAVNVKTVNGNSLLGSGDITISGSGGTGGGKLQILNRATAPIAISVLSGLLPVLNHSGVTTTQVGVS